MSAVVSKNLFELLGNTHDEDSDKEIEPPVKVVEKSIMRTSKRNAPAEAPASRAPASFDSKRGNRGFSGNEGAFRDNNAGSAKNRGKPTDGFEREKFSGSNEGRGRGGRGGPRNFDRHSRGGIRISEKQINNAWGSNEGGAELSDEQAGEALANAEKNASFSKGTEDPKTEPTQEPEPEDVSISYADYIIQQNEKKAALAAQAPQIRKPNEGNSQNSKWENAKPISKDEAEDFFQGSGGKVKRERERRQKQTIEIDPRFVETSDRGGRGGGIQGGRGSRGGRGGRGDGYQRGGNSGGRKNTAPSTPINTEDTSAFPSLGSS